MENTTDSMPNEAHSNDGETICVEVSESTHSFPPEVGMEFESDEQAISYYNRYAGSIGFSIRKEYCNKSKSGYISSRKLCCYKEGYRGKDRRDAFVKNPRKNTRTGCLAHIVYSRDQSNGKYRVTSFELEHNHPLAPKGTAHLLPSQRKLIRVEAERVALADGSVAAPTSTRKLLARKADGRAYTGYTDKEHRNYLRTKRRRDMKLGDAGIVLHYFERRRLEDPSFFFAKQLDVDDLITNVFWADTKMIIDHKLFGDVVFFDTPYITNRNFRPFALFAGMNQYRKMLVFGAAFMYDDTVESYKWLFETFLKAMSGRKPNTILTDQDEALRMAISLVMPEAFHGLCVGRMGQNAFRHLNHVFRSSDSFGKDFHNCLNEYEEEMDFLNAWEFMLQKYDLRDNDWLNGIFAQKEKWALVYRRQAFSGGMRSTQLTESFHSALRDYLKSELDFVDFFEHFERAVDDERYKELRASYDMTQRIPLLKVQLPLLIHARSIYTTVIFEMFQDEWAKSLLVLVSSCIEEGSCQIYKVSTVSDTQEHTVVAKPSDVFVSCSCKKFEYIGILCSHALKILDTMNVKMMVPSHYILKRWTKDARAGCIELLNDVDTEEDPILLVKNRYRTLCRTFLQIAARASETQEGYELAVNYSKELASELEAGSAPEKSSEAPAGVDALDIGSNQMISVDSANVLRAKGAKQMALGRHGNPRRHSIQQAYQTSQGLEESAPMSWPAYQQTQSMHQGTLRGVYIQRDSRCLDLFEDSQGPNATQHHQG